MLKTDQWYCFSIPADHNTVLHVDFLVTGMNPEENDFEARQNGEAVAGEHNHRSASFEITSEHDTPIDLCWRKKDRKTKKLDFHWKRNQKHSQEAADTSTLDSLKDDLLLL